MLAAAALSGGCLGGGGRDAAGGPTTLAGVVARVVDGDTVRVRADGGSTTVRLVGIDTPEVARPDVPEQCFGPEASRRTADLLPPGTPVTVVTDPGQDTHDRFGRLLGYVYVGEGAGAEASVNYRLVAGGHARAYVHRGEPFRYAAAFEGAERRARRDGAGLWGPPCRGRERDDGSRARR